MVTRRSWPERLVSRASPERLVVEKQCVSMSNLRPAGGRGADLAVSMTHVHSLDRIFEAGAADAGGGGPAEVAAASCLLAALLLDARAPTVRSALLSRYAEYFIK